MTAIGLMACGVWAQNRLAFEVASVKAVEAGNRGGGPLHGGPGTNSPGQLSGVATMKALLMRAYGLKPFQISGPGWMETERYEIDAKIPAGASREQVAAMLRGLLAERFHLEAHTETKEMPVYALVVGKGGAKLKAADEKGREDAGVPKLVQGADGLPELAPGTTAPRSYEVAIGGSDGVRYKWWARRESMGMLADALTSHLNRPVVDETGQMAQYDSL